MMIGSSHKNHNELIDGGLQSLEQMNLDNDDASPGFDPLNFGAMGGGGGYSN